VSATNRAGNEENPEPEELPHVTTGGLPQEAEESANFADVKQLGLVAAITSLSYVFWICGGMEMIERLAYYGVKAVATLYAVAPAKDGGLGVTLGSFGNILATWALFQSIVPAITGGLSDRYGYKETIFVSTVVKISGYLVMAFFPTYGGFFAGALLLATGTAIFKPGIQATLVRSTSRENSSMAWGIFYQTVNIGGFLGPLVAGYMRKLAWRNVFLACAVIICMNFLMLLTYKEPGKEERLERARQEKAGTLKRKNLVAESLIELKKTHVWLYLLIFSGFWFMFNALFDVLPNHIQDWVDTRSIVTTLFGTEGTTNPVVKFFIVMNKSGTEIQPEGMLNINAGLIMLTCFLFASLSGKMRATTSMVIGTLFASLAIVLSGFSTLGWISVGAIAIFSVGEMLSSPKFSEFIGNFAPNDKKAMYLGFSQVPLAVGWTLEGKVGPSLYEHFASKERFAREMLEEKGLLVGDALKALKEGEAFDKLVELSHLDKWTVTHQLYATHNVGMVWYIMAVVGLATAFGIYLYGQWISRLMKTK
jgi:MFS family permease